MYYKRRILKPTTYYVLWRNYYKSDTHSLCYRNINTEAYSTQAIVYVMHLLKHYFRKFAQSKRPDKISYQLILLGPFLYYSILKPKKSATQFSG